MSLLPRVKKKKKKKKKKEGNRDLAAYWMNMR